MPFLCEGSILCTYGKDIMGNKDLEERRNLIMQRLFSQIIIFRLIQECDPCVYLRCTLCIGYSPNDPERDRP